ncbi:uncharacterized protein LOC144606612 [Rhinoraja longicauda]
MSPDVVVMPPDMMVMSPDVVVMLPDVMVMSPDVVMMPPDVMVMSPDVAMMSPDVGVMSPDVVVMSPDVEVIPPDVAVIPPDVAVTSPDVAVTSPDVAMTSPDVTVTSPDVAVMSPDVLGRCRGDWTFTNTVLLSQQEGAVMVLNYSPRWALTGESLHRRGLVLGSHQRFHSQDVAQQPRARRYTGHLDIETLVYPSYQDHQHRMLVQFPVLHKTWRSCLGKVTLDSFHRSRLGLQDYWTNPQRAYHIGCVSCSARKHVLVLPGNTGISDVESTITPGLCHYRHKLLWKYRWQKLRENHLTSKLCGSAPPSRGWEFQWLHRAVVRS